MIYANSREVRQADIEEVQKWILSLLKPQYTPTTRALKKGFIFEGLLTKYCKIIGHKYPEHICSKCNKGDDTIPRSPIRVKKTRQFARKDSRKM